MRRGVLVHERLAIVDPASGAQPLRTRHGERTRARGQRRDLQPPRAARGLRRPYAFRTELRLRGDPGALPRDGRDFFRRAQRHLRVRAATTRAQRYLIARDPIGVVPLYLGPRRRRPCCYVASEMKALVPVCDDVREFPPGHMLRQRERRRAAPLLRHAMARLRRRCGARVAHAELRAALERAVHRAADDRRAVRRAAVGRTRFVADRRRGGPLSRASASRTDDTSRGVVAAAALVRDRAGGLAGPGRGRSVAADAHRHRAPRLRLHGRRRASTRCPT